MTNHQVLGCQDLRRIFLGRLRFNRRGLVSNPCRGSLLGRGVAYHPAEQGRGAQEEGALHSGLGLLDGRWIAPFDGKTRGSNLRDNEALISWIV